MQFFQLTTMLQPIDPGQQSRVLVGSRIANTDQEAIFLFAEKNLNAHPGYKLSAVVATPINVSLN